MRLYKFHEHNSFKSVGNDVGKVVIIISEHQTESLKQGPTNYESRPKWVWVLLEGGRGLTTHRALPGKHDQNQEGSGSHQSVGGWPPVPGPVLRLPLGQLPAHHAGAGGYIVQPGGGSGGRPVVCRDLLWQWGAELWGGVVHGHSARHQGGGQCCRDDPCHAQRKRILGERWGEGQVQYPGTECCVAFPHTQYFTCTVYFN